MKFAAKLQDWLAQGFISQEQLEKIQKYENNKNSSWVVTGFLILGAIVVGLGVISIVAANWQQIPVSVKLLVDFIILFAIALLIIKYYDLKQFLKADMLLIGFLLFCLASLGLIAQIYNVSGSLYEMLLFWSCITFVSILISKHAAVSTLWMTIFLVGLLFACFDSKTGSNIFHGRAELIFMNVTFLCAGFLFVSKTVPKIGVFTYGLRAATFIMGVVTICMSELLKTTIETPVDQSAYGSLYLLSALLYLFAIAAIWQNEVYFKLQRTMLIIALSLLLLMANLNLLEIKENVFYALCTIGILGSMAIFFASKNNRYAFNQCLLLLGIRFLFLYFQALGGLAATGIGLVFSGILIILAAVAWFKYAAVLWRFVEKINDDK